MYILAIYAISKADLSPFLSSKASAKSCKCYFYTIGYNVTKGGKSPQEKQSKYYWQWILFYIIKGNTYIIAFWNKCVKNHAHYEMII